jgi:hypothetical protein
MFQLFTTFSRLGKHQQKAIAAQLAVVEHKGSLRSSAAFCVFLLSFSAVAPRTIYAKMCTIVHLTSEGRSIEPFPARETASMAAPRLN